MHRELAGFGFRRVLGEEDANLLLVIIALRGQDREVLVELAVPALQEGLVRQVIAVLGRQRVLAVQQHLADGAPDREQVVRLLSLHARGPGHAITCRRAGAAAGGGATQRIACGQSLQLGCEGRRSAAGGLGSSQATGHAGRASARKGPRSHA